MAEDTEFIQISCNFAEDMSKDQRQTYVDDCVADGFAIEEEQKEPDGTYILVTMRKEIVP